MQYFSIWINDLSKIEPRYDFFNVFLDAFDSHLQTIDSPVHAKSRTIFFLHKINVCLS